MDATALDRFLRDLEGTLRRLDLLAPAAPVLVGVSGGPDSLCLLHSLHRLGYDVRVAHLDHALRPESADDAEFVAVVARKLGVPFVVGRADVRAVAEAEGLSIEEAARIARYRFLARAAAHAGTHTVAVGHTADDQAETVLMHLLRGAGLSGLRGMRPRTSMDAMRLGADVPGGIQLVRPLLFTRRVLTESYCRAVGLQPQFDRSNLDTTFFRNRLRREILPMLGALNPRIHDVLGRTAEVLAADAEIVKAVVDQAWAEVVRGVEADAVRLDRAAFLRHPLAVRRGLLRRAIAQLRPGLRDIDFGPVETAIEFIANPPRRRQTDLAAGLMLDISAAEATVREWSASPDAGDVPQLSPDAELALAPPAMFTFPSRGWTFTADVLPVGEDVLESARGNTDRWRAYFDAEAAGPNLTLRTRRPGDRIRPMGMGGHSIKLSDLMINCKIPASARERWPVLADGDSVLWLPGMRQSEVGLVGDGTCHVMVLRLVRDE